MSRKTEYVHNPCFLSANILKILGVFAENQIKFSLLGETILEWNDKDIEHYHAQRMAMDSMLCRFKATYPAERIDSVRHLLEDKERQMCQIVQILEQQQAINDKITSQVPVLYLSDCYPALYFLFYPTQHLHFHPLL